MKSVFLLSFLSLLSPFATAENKFSTLKEWFEAGTNISLNDLAETEDKIYMGRCYNRSEERASFLGVIQRPGGDKPAALSEKTWLLFSITISTEDDPMAAFLGSWSKMRARQELIMYFSEFERQLGLKVEIRDYLGTVSSQFTGLAKEKPFKIMMPVRKFGDDLVSIVHPEEVGETKEKSLSKDQITMACHYFKSL